MGRIDDRTNLETLRRANERFGLFFLRFSGAPALGTGEEVEALLQIERSLESVAPYLDGRLQQSETPEVRAELASYRANLVRLRDRTCNHAERPPPVATPACSHVGTICMQRKPGPLHLAPPDDGLRSAPSLSNHGHRVLKADATAAARNYKPFVSLCRTAICGQRRMAFCVYLPGWTQTPAVGHKSSNAGVALTSEKV